MEKILIIVSIIGMVNGMIYYTDQKLNCSKTVTGTFCYNGPKFDQWGQYKSCAKQGTIAITFDDGPSEYTAHILDVLKKYNMKATFNIIGKKIRNYKDIIQRMADEGHQIASHTYNHVDLVNASVTQYEMEQFEIALIRENFNGVLSNQSIPHYIRAPHGFMAEDSIQVLRNMEYLPIHWGALTHDSDGVTAEDIVHIYYSHFGGLTGTGIYSDNLTMITQQHDTERNTSATMEAVANYLNSTFGARGVKFVTMAECLNNIQPMYYRTPRLQNDPTCANGIRGDNNACCPKSCGKCGGTGCSEQIGGADNCCSANIAQAKYSCDLSPAPCVIQTAPTSMEADPTCKNGIKKNNLCCLGTCDTCGGSGCSLYLGGSKGCCSASILNANMSCQTNPAPCVIY